MKDLHCFEKYKRAGNIKSFTVGKTELKFLVIYALSNKSYFRNS